MDATLQAAFSSMAELGALSPTQLEQLSLPVRQGGCGVGGLSLKHSGAFASSWALCLAPVLARLPAADALSVTSALQAGDRSHPVASALLQAHDALRACGVADAKLPDWGACAVAPRRGCQHALSAAVAVAACSRDSSRSMLPGSVPVGARVRGSSSFVRRRRVGILSSSMGPSAMPCAGAWA